MSTPVPLIKGNLTVDQVNQSIVDVNILMANLGNPGVLDTISVITAHGISGAAVTSGTNAALTLALAAITPTTIVASSTISGSNLSGTNTGDQTLVGLGGASLTAAQQFSGGQAVSSTAVTSSSNLTAINLALNNNFSMTMTEDTTLSNPTNIVAGQSGRIVLTQAAGDYDVAFGTYYKFPGGVTPTVNSTSAGAIDVLYYDVLDATHIACVFIVGFA